MGAKSTPSTWAKAKSAAKKKAAAELPDPNAQKLSTISEGNEDQSIFDLEDFTVGSSDKENLPDNDLSFDEETGESERGHRDKLGSKGSSDNAISVNNANEGMY